MASKSKVLTEAEITKMPKSDYMNAAQLRFFRERLLDLQRQLRENAGATTEHLRELSFAPVAAIGWPRPIAPPFGLTRTVSNSRSFRTASPWAASVSR